MTTFDPTRHQSVFCPATFGAQRVAVVGCGATGSYVALQLAKLGIRNIDLYDGDVVENHNIANQLFGPYDVGRNKAAALRDILIALAGHYALHVNVGGFITPDMLPQVFYNTSYVFLLVDNLEARRFIAEGAGNCILLKSMIETRLGTRHVEVRSFRPSRREQLANFISTIHDDAEVETSACGTSVTVGPTAAFLASLAVWRFINITTDADEQQYCSQLLCLEPPLFEEAFR